MKTSIKLDRKTTVWMYDHTKNDDLLYKLPEKMNRILEQNIALLQELAMVTISQSEQLRLKGVCLVKWKRMQ